MNDDIEIPLNILKEKILYCLPKDSEIDDDAVIITSKALNFFLKTFSSNIPLNSNEEKKILIKDIKVCIDNNKKFSFLKKLIER